MKGNGRMLKNWGNLAISLSQWLYVFTKHTEVTPKM